MTPDQSRTTRALTLEPTACSVCGTVSRHPVGVGEDFEYRTSRRRFLAMRCARCQLLYLDPRPAATELHTHLSRRLPRLRLHRGATSASSTGSVPDSRPDGCCGPARACRPAGGRILDVGCGDGFHLDLLRTYGQIRLAARSASISTSERSPTVGRGLDVEHGVDRGPDSRPGSYRPRDPHPDDRARDRSGRPCCATIAAPCSAPAVRVLVVTDNTDSFDARLVAKRSWGGYHFPRHLEPVQPAIAAPPPQRPPGSRSTRLTTMVSPVNWTYSLRNLLDDLGTPRSWSTASLSGDADQPRPPSPPSTVRPMDRSWRAVASRPSADRR